MHQAQEMATVCISNCIDDTRFPARANYVSLHKWPESDAEFVNKAGGTAAAKLSAGEGQWRYLHPGVVDSVSCRQLYLRSAYTFSKKQSVPERAKKCFGRVRERVTSNGKKTRKLRPPGRRRRRGRKLLIMRRVKEFSREALCSIFQKLLSCTATVDVVEHGD